MKRNTPLASLISCKLGQYIKWPVSKLKEQSDSLCNISRVHFEAPEESLQHGLLLAANFHVLVYETIPSLWENV